MRENGVAETLFRNRAFKQLHGGIQTVLLNHEQALTSFVSSLNHALAIV